MLSTVARIVGKFKRLFKGRGEEERVEEPEDEHVREAREEAIQRALQIASKQLEPEKLVETARKDMSKALDELREYFGFEWMAVIDERGKPIGMSGDGSFDHELIDAIKRVFETARDADTIIVSSEEGSNYLAVKVNGSVAICETKTTPSDADVFMLRSDLSMVVESAKTPSPTKEESEVPYVITDRQGLVVDSQGIREPDRAAAEISRLIDLLDDYMEVHLEWVKLGTKSGKTLAVKPYKDVLIAFVVESDPEEVDEKCEKIAKSLTSKLELLIGHAAESSGSKAESPNEG
ncbi:MAG: hypothetical protein ABGY09_02110 [Euryarchaeota archaeon]